MKKKVNLLFMLSLLIIVVIGGIVWADTSGVWHKAEDVRGGIFGDDEQADTMDYTFINPVKFNNSIKVDVIKSNNNNGNVIIQLG